MSQLAKYGSKKSVLFLYCFFATLPLVGYGLPIHGIFTIQISYLFALVLIIGIFLTLNRRQVLYRSPVNYLITFFFSICILSALSAVFLSAEKVGGEVPWLRSLKQLVGLAFMILIYFAIIAYVDTEHKFRGCLNIYLISALLVSLIGIYQFISIYLHLDLPLGRSLPINNLSIGGTSSWSSQWQGLPRVSATLIEPAYLGDYLVTVIPIALAGIFLKEYFFTKSRQNFLIVAAVYLCVLISTFSRAPYIGLISAIIVMIAVSSNFNLTRALAKIIKLSLVLIIIGFVLTFVLKSSLLEITVGRLLSLADENDYSVMERTSKAIAAINIFKAHPTFGVGYGNFGFYYPDYAPQSIGFDHIKDLHRFDTANNLYGELIAETGITGVAAFCVMVILTFREGLRTYRQTASKFFKATSLGLISAFAGYLVILLSADFIYILPFMWVLMGLIVAQRRLHYKREAARRICDY